MNAFLSAMRQTVLASELRRAEIFAPCSSETIRRVALHTEVLTLSRGKPLFRENASAPAVFVVQRGAVRLTHQTIVGTEQVVHVFRPHESMAEDTLVAGRRCWGTAVAAEESQILAVQREGLLDVMKDDPELSLSLLAALGRQSRMLVDRIRDLTSNDVQTRMVNWLLDHCPDSHSGRPHTIRLPETKRSVAAELGIRSETFSRALARMNQQRLVCSQGRTLTVLCPSRLTELVAAGAE